MRLLHVNLNPVFCTDSDALFLIRMCVKKVQPLLGHIQCALSQCRALDEVHIRMAYARAALSRALYAFGAFVTKLSGYSDSIKAFDQLFDLDSQAALSRRLLTPFIHRSKTNTQGIQLYSQTKISVCL